MVFKAGTVTYLAFDNAAGTPVNLSGYADKIGSPQTTKMLDVSVFGTQAMAFIPGLSNGDTFTMSGPYDATLWTHMTQAKGTSDAGTTLTMLYGPGGSVSGQAKTSFETFIASFQVDTTVAGRVEWSASLQVTGAVTNTTF